MLPKGLLKEYSRPLSFLLRSLDMIAVLGAGLLAYFYKFEDVDLSNHYQSALLIGAITSAIVFSFFNMYQSARGNHLWMHFVNIAKSIIVIIVLLSGLAFLTKTGDYFSRTWFMLWWGCAFVLLSLFRCSLFISLRLMRAHGWNERRIVIIGAGELGERLAETMQQALWTGFHIVAILDDNAQDNSRLFHRIPIQPTPKSISAYLANNKETIDEVWIALPLQAEARVKEILHELRHDTVTTRLILDIFGMDLLNHSISDLAGFPVINIRSTPMVGGNRLVKAIEDRMLAAFILLLISPLLFIIAFAVKLSSRGPVFYRQKRVGWNGAEFEMLKFRTMPINAEEKTGPVWATSGETRATRVGAFLRKTSLDELPQFFNVLKGEMSIVGPRPERAVFVEQFKEQIPRYMQKHVVKAGITGWAQINGWRGNTSLEKRIEYDLYYIENWSLGFDLKIILLTFFRGFINKNAY